MLTGLIIKIEFNRIIFSNITKTFMIVNRINLM